MQNTMTRREAMRGALEATEPGRETWAMAKMRDMAVRIVLYNIERGDDSIGALMAAESLFSIGFVMLYESEGR